MLALKGKPDVLRFIKTCRNPVLTCANQIFRVDRPPPHAVDALLDLDWSLPAQVLSEFLVPPRVQAAMKECDTNDDGELDRDEWKVLSSA